MKRLLFILCLNFASEMLLASAAANQPGHTTAVPLRSALKGTAAPRAGKRDHITINETVVVDCFDALDPIRAAQFDSQIVFPEGSSSPLARWQTRAEGAAIPHEDDEDDGYIASHPVKLKSFADHKKQEEAHKKIKITAERKS